jgi:DNA-binding response OmpR family regulator
MNDTRPRILVLCTDATSMRGITAALSRSCDLIWVRDGEALLRLADLEQPAAAMVDIAVPSANAIETLQNLKARRSETRRILLTDYCDLGLIVQGLHTGAVQSIVYKPVHPAELAAAVGGQVVQTVPTYPTLVPSRVPA